MPCRDTRIHARPLAELGGLPVCAIRPALTDSFEGLQLNLEVVGQSKGDGRKLADHRVPRGGARMRVSRHGIADAEPAWADSSRRCRVIDMTDPTIRTPTGYLQTTSMLDPGNR